MHVWKAQIAIVGDSWLGLSINDVLDLWTTTATIRRAPTATHQWIYIYRSLQHARLRRGQNRTVYAVLNLKQNLRSTYCSEANDRHEASLGLFATADSFLFKLNGMAIFRRGTTNRGVECRGVWTNRDFWPLSCFISEVIQDIAIVTMAN